MEYDEFIRAKMVAAPKLGFDVDAAMVCRDANGAVWSIWVDCRDAQRVLAEMPETVCGTFEPSTISMTKTCRRFVDDVAEALTD